ncbi:MULTISPECIES: ThuA domain-containing protein [unclassified Microbispora]|uniref:ThuA domain-containing protein n=1 Tax=unclassified Microbispora TaxID=2614687 RepID=UPI001602FB1A|nr:MULTISPECIES: ThuA domain-containing protein [unclassified Microbispora]
MSSRTRSGLRSRAALATAALAVPALVLGSTGPAAAAESGAAPVLDTATLSPIAEPNYNGATNTAYTPSTTTGAGGWFINDEVTLNLSATDDDAVASFVVTVGTEAAVTVPAVRSGNRGTATYVVKGDRNSTVRYVAVDAAGNASAAKTISVRIDTKPPVAAWPGVSGGKVAHSAAAASITPTRTDPTPGSGGAAVRDMWIDGKWAYPLPLDPATLSVGVHTWAVALGDAAGNGAKYTLTFQITTSVGDVRALVQRYVSAGKVSASNGDRLLALLAQADAGGDAAVSALTSFGALAAQVVPEGYMRDSLVQDAAYLVEELRGVKHPDVATGVTVSAAPGMERAPFRLPTASVVNKKPKFRVLLFGNQPGAFRHEHIPLTMAVIQDMGRANNFDVDVYDYLSPDVSVPNPFESIERLSKYDVVIGVSSVGNGVFSTARPTQADPNVKVDEQAVLKQFVNQGGGFVALHGATDSMHGWDWYKGLAGGEFDNHGSNGSGLQNTCGACNIGELVTEDDTNPATSQFPERLKIVDELYNWVGLPRQKTHVLQTLNESTYVGSIGASAGRVEGADHPISWCQNYDGGRSFTQALLHNWQNTLDPLFQKNMLEGIKWAAGRTEANCVSHDEVRKLVAAGTADGSIDAGLAADLNQALTASYDAYLVKDYADALTQATTLRRLIDSSQGGRAHSVLRDRAHELVTWMRTLDGKSVHLGFVSQPKTTAVGAGELAVFSAPAEGRNVAYQWQVKSPGSADWTDMTGEKSFAIAVTAAPEVADSEYRVRITDPTGEVVSRSASLKVSGR